MSVLRVVLTDRRYFEVSPQKKVFCLIFGGFSYNKCNRDNIFTILRPPEKWSLFGRKRSVLNGNINPFKTFEGGIR